MEIVGIDLIKTEATREKAVPYQNIDVKIKLNGLKMEKKSVKVEFENNIIYNPGIGNLKFIGNIYLHDKEDEMKKLVEHWEKNKKIHESIQPQLIDLITANCCLNGVLVARTINLPAPVLPLNVGILKKAAEEKG